jgi:uncharacterized protein YPO0396
VRYNKQHVLDSLRENRQAHKERHYAARRKWREDVKARYQRALDQFESGSFKNAANPLIRYPRPKLRLDEYDRAIEQVEAAVPNSQGSIHLSTDEYDAYVRDLWWWKGTQSVGFSTNMVVSA